MDRRRARRRVSFRGYVGGSQPAVGFEGSGLGYQSLGTSVAIQFDEYLFVSQTGLGINGTLPTTSGTNRPVNVTGLPPFYALDANYHSAVYRVTLSYDPTQPGGGTLHQTISVPATGATFTQDWVRAPW